MVGTIMYMYVYIHTYYVCRKPARDSYLFNGSSVVKRQKRSPYNFVTSVCPYVTANLFVTMGTIWLKFVANSQVSHVNQFNSHIIKNKK